MRQICEGSIEGTSGTDRYISGKGASDVLKDVGLPGIELQTSDKL